MNESADDQCVSREAVVNDIRAATKVGNPASGLPPGATVNELTEAEFLTKCNDFD